MNNLRAGTAVDVLIGPFLDITDGATAETGETPAVKLSKNGQALAAKNDATTPVHDADGYHNCELDATDTNTVGNLVLTVAATATALPIRHEFQVLAASAYDTLYGSSPTLLTAADVGLVYESAINTVTGQTEFIMTTAFPVDDSWIGCEVSLEDVSTGIFYSGNIWISDAVQSTETLHINAAFPVTVVAGDIIRIYARQHAQYALTLYDPPTRAEATTDKEAIQAKQLAYARLMMRSDAAPTTDDATELTAINADAGAGAGTYAATDAIQAVADKTGSLTFTTAGIVDANVQQINDVTITGDGGDTPFDVV